MINFLTIRSQHGSKNKKKVLFGALLATIGFGAIFSAMENRAPASAAAMLTQPQAPYPAPTEKSYAKQASYAKPVSDNTCHTGPNSGRYRLVPGKKRYDC